MPKITFGRFECDITCGSSIIRTERVELFEHKINSLLDLSRVVLSSIEFISIAELGLLHSAAFQLVHGASVHP